MMIGDESESALLPMVFLNSVKSVIVHLLKYRGETLYGCQTNHPSRKHHKCLLESPECFIQNPKLHPTLDTVEIALLWMVADHWKEFFAYPQN